MVALRSPRGDVVEVPEERAEQLRQRGYVDAGEKAPKATKKAEKTEKAD